MGLVVLEVLFVVVEDKELGEVCDFLVLSCCFPGPHMATWTLCEKRNVFFNKMGAMQLLFFTIPSTLILEHVIFFCCVANSNELWRDEIHAPNPRHG